MTPEQEEHVRTILILSRTAEMLGEALAGRARFEVREEARDALAQARRRCAWGDSLFDSTPSSEKDSA